MVLKPHFQSHNGVIQIRQNIWVSSIGKKSLIRFSQDPNYWFTLYFVDVFKKFLTPTNTCAVIAKAGKAPQEHGHTLIAAAKKLNPLISKIEGDGGEKEG